MNWDDELDRLIIAVHRAFGDEVLRDALARALRDASRQSEPIVEGSELAALLPPERVADGSAAVIPSGLFGKLLKAELRRLMRAH
jgi:hypothetical protein